MFDARRSQAELFFRRIGITFAVYGDDEATERLIPFDIIPRVLTMPEWARSRAGLEQRVTRAQRLPARHLRPAANASRPASFRPTWSVRNPLLPPGDGRARGPARRLLPHRRHRHRPRRRRAFYVLEDNARTPSGVSYMLENREVMMRLFPELFAEHRVAPVENYPDAAARDPALGRAPRRRRRPDRRCC